MGRAPSTAHHPRVSLPVCGCLLSADATQRVSLSLPISSPCQPSAVGKCGSCQAEAGSAHEQSQQCSANLASPPQEMCFGSALTQQGQSFSLLFHGLCSCPKKEQRGEMNIKTQQSRSEGAPAHTAPRDCRAQTAPEILDCPLVTHCPLLPPTVLALAAL